MIVLTLLLCDVGMGAKRQRSEQRATGPAGPAPAMTVLWT